MNPDNLYRPNTKWEFRGFADVSVKVVLDRQPFLGTGPLPDWLRSLAHARAGPIVPLDTYRDNLCLWRCIAVHRGARPDRCTNTARLLAKGFFRFNFIPNDTPKTSLDQLDVVEMYLNKGKPVSDWIGIRVYEPDRCRDGTVVWYLARISLAKIENVMTIGVYDGHAFLIRDIEKLTKVYACDNSHARLPG